MTRYLRVLVSIRNVLSNVIQGKPMEVRLSNLVAAKGVVSHFKLAEVIS